MAQPPPATAATAAPSSPQSLSTGGTGSQAASTSGQAAGSPAAAASAAAARLQARRSASSAAQEAGLEEAAIAFFNQLRQRQRDCILEIQLLSGELAAVEQRIEELRARLGIREPELDAKTLLDRAVNQFNDKPAKGIAMLVEKGVLPSQNAKEVAEFLLHTPGLSKTAVGEYLGEYNPFNLEVGRAGATARCAANSFGCLGLRRGWRDSPLLSFWCRKEEANRTGETADTNRISGTTDVPAFFANSTRMRLLFPSLHRCWQNSRSCKTSRT